MMTMMVAQGPCQVRVVYLRPGHLNHVDVLYV